MLVVSADVRANRRDQGRDAAERAAPDPFARDLGKETLDEVQPRGPRRSEVEVEPRMLEHPGFHGRMRVRTVVVQDQMDVSSTGRLPIDLVQEGKELRVRVAGLARFDHM